MRSFHILCASLLGLGLGLVLALPLARAGAGAATISPGEIKEGMKGYGLTVFKGTEPERFDVEVVGVLHNFRPAQDLILVKTPHPRLNVTKNVKGMSGSPIYIEGRLAGAYAYSLSSFQTEPVAGVTPIALMLSELARQPAPGFWPLEGAPLPRARPGAAPKADGKRSDLSGTRWNGAIGGWSLDAHAGQIAARLAGNDGRVTVAGTPLLVGGLTKGAMAFAERTFGAIGLEPVAAGGGPSTPVAGAPEHFVDGGTLGVQLARGDVSYMGLGTVTHVEGRRLCGFGHPMMGNGDIALPTAIARVLWIYASLQHSFKVGEAIRPLGALVEDRQSAVVADETKTAPTFPVTVDIKGAPQAPKTHWQMAVAEERFMTPGLVASMLGSAVEATVAESRDATWQMHTKIKVAGYGALETDDFGIAIGGMPEAGDFGSSRAVRALGQLYNNPWSNVRIESVEATLSVQFSRDLWRLRGIEALDPIVDAGQKARVVLHLVPFSGPEALRTVELTVPADLAGKEVEIEVAPGYEVPIDTAAPETTAELLANLAKQSFPARSVVVQLHAAQPGIAFRGHVAARLPDFALDALRPTTSSVGPEPIASWVRTVVPLEKYLAGRDKVKVKVRSIVR